MRFFGSFGAPRGELRGYAEQRGLVHHGSVAPPGYATHVGFDPFFNLVEGLLPGGLYGIALHQHFDEDDSRGLQNRHVKHHVTRVIVPLAAGIGSIQRMSIRPFEFEDPEFGWAQVPPDRYGIDGRYLYFGVNADRPAIDAVLSAAAPWLVSAESPGAWEDMDLRFDYGLFSLATKGYLEDAALDAACEAACSVAVALREASLAAHPPRPFADQLDAPFWAGTEPGHAAPPANPVQTPDSQGLESPPAESWVTAMTKCAQLMPTMNRFEDSLQFHRAYPWLPAPGHAIAVIDGTLPGSEVHGRVALLIERATGSGVNGVMMAVKDGSSTTSPAFEYGTDLQAGIRDGVATFWRPRDGTSVARGMPELVAAALEHAHRRGWL